MFRESLRAQLTAVHGVALVRSRCHSLAILDTQLDAAAHRAISAGGAHPLVRNPFGGDVSGRLVACVRVVRAADIDAQPLAETHAALLPGAPNAAATFLGTTL